MPSPAHPPTRTPAQHVTSLESRETKRYLEMFYILQMRRLVAKVGYYEGVGILGSGVAVVELPCCL